MLPIIAWRNIWRNKLRSSVLVLSIVLGLWAGIFAIALVNGVNHQRNLNIIENQSSHIQIHYPDFKANYEIGLSLDTEKVIAVLHEQEGIEAYSERTILTGMIGTARNSMGVMIRGINPDREQAVTGMDKHIVDGTYFETDRSKPILIGKPLAEELKVKVGKKVKLNFQDRDINLNAQSFRVVGIYSTSDTRQDKLGVYVLQDEINKFAGLENASHEIAIILEDDANQLESITTELKGKLPGLETQSWKELLPWLDSANIIADRMNVLLLAIIMLALSFGIVNTMLMSVLERVRELGMLMAVGMGKGKVFLMIVLETIFVMLTATPFGLILATLSVGYLSEHGMDMSSYSDGFGNIGLKPIIYPFLKEGYYWNVVILVIVSAFLAALYPARKATQLNPADAIRKI